MELVVSDYDITSAEMDCPFAHIEDDRTLERWVRAEDHPTLDCYGGRVEVGILLTFLARRG